MTASEAPRTLLVPLWLGIVVLACLPFTLAALGRLGRWWSAGRPLVLPLDGAWPAVLWPAWFGTGLFLVLFLLTVGVASVYAGAARAGLLPWEPLPVPAMFSPGVFLAQVVPAVAGLALIRAFGRRAFSVVGLRRGDLGRGLLYGAVACAAVLPVCVAALWLNALLLLFWRVPIELHPLLQTVGTADGAWVLPLALVQAVLVASLAEEFLYRGLLMVSLLKELGAGGALLVSSALFGLAHLPLEPQAVLPLFVLGLALGYVAYRTRSLVAPVLAHSLFNAVMILGTFYG